VPQAAWTLKLRLVCAALLFPSLAAADIVGDVRAALARNDLSLAEQLVQAHRAAHGVTPQGLAAFAWLTRGALGAGDLDKAGAYADETHKLVMDMLKRRPLDADRHLPLALGAAIEVRAQAMAARGERASAVEHLRRELAAFRNTSIRARIQKNIHLLSLEGRPAPPLEMAEWLGPRPSPLAALRGKPVLLFFWAHWCGDCKAQAPILERLKSEFAPKGLVIVAPTQRYGYKARGEDATPEEELKYIEEIRQRHFAGLVDVPAPLSEENFKVYGVSTTPTLVLLDRRGIVRLYHPGEMSEEELTPKVAALVRP